MFDEARINDEDYSVYCDGRFGNVRGQYNLASAFRGRLEDLSLEIRGKVGIDGAYDQFGDFIAQCTRCLG